MNKEILFIQADDDKRRENFIESKFFIKCEHQKEEGKLPTFEIVGYTGAIIEQWFGKVIVELSGMDISKQIPILWSHDTDEPIGHTTSIENVEGKGIVLKGVISGDPDDKNVKRFLSMTKNGFEWQASIGAPILKAMHLEDGEVETVNGMEVTGPIMIAKATQLVETSIVTLGADSNTTTQVSASGADSLNHDYKEIDMDFSKWLKANGFGLAKDHSKEVLASLELQFNKSISAQKELDIAIEAGKTSKSSESTLVSVQAELAEMKRIDGIRVEAKGYPEIEKDAIEGNWAVNQVVASVQSLKKIEANSTAPVSNISIKGATTEGAVEASMSLAMGIKADSLKGNLSDDDIDAATSIKGMSFSKAASLLLAANGTYDMGMGNIDMLTLAFSTTSLPLLINNTANKKLMDGYNMRESQISSVARLLQTKDFQTNTLAGIFEDLVLEKLGEHGEMKHGTVSDRSYPYSVDQYAKTFSVGRKTLINDSLGALADVFNGYGKGASTAEQRDFWLTFVTGAGSFYSVGNGNLVTTNALSIDGVTAAKTALADQVDSNGDPIIVNSLQLVVPTALGTYARQIASELMVNETTTSNKAKPASNPHAGTVTVVEEAYLNNANVAGGSATTWYLQASPSDLASHAYVRLEGESEPTIRQGQLGIGGLGVESDCVFDFGSAQLDPKGIVKNTI